MNTGATAARAIRVLLVDDSPLTLEVVKRMLSSAPEIVVAGCAGDGAEALDLIPSLRPDVICTDLHMPRMDGLEFIRVVMARFPLPILVLSVSVQDGQSRNIFQMLEAGALDILAKPDGLEATQDPAAALELIQKIRILSGVKVMRRRTTGPIPPPAPQTPPPIGLGIRPRIIGIGASTGGPQAIATVLRDLPANLDLPVVCVQHISEGFMGGLVSWLASGCDLKVKTAEEGATPLAGTVYLPPDNRHLEIGPDGRFRCARSSPISGHRPSIDVAFASLARSYGGAAVGVLLTGMGEDGAQGMLDISQSGGLTIAQNEATCIVFGMPRRAIERGAARHVLPLTQIGPALRGLMARDGKEGEMTTNGNLMKGTADGLDP